MASREQGSGRERRDGGGRRRPRVLLRPAGIPVRADATLFVIAGLVTWSFWLRFDTTESRSTAAAMAVVAAGLFLVSILAHELAHAVEARRRGLEVEDITLYVFGGATRITTDIERPADEAALTAVGPWTSIALGCAFGLVADAAGAGPIGEVAGELGWLNVILGVFNLLPGAPLDGGRLLEAAVWRVTGDRVRAAQVSSSAGRGLGGLLVALGMAELLLVSGGFIGGLWAMLIGWFLYRTAGAEGELAVVRDELRGRRVRALAAPVGTVPAGAGLDEAVEVSLRLGRTDVVLVTGPDGSAVGVLDLAAPARRVPAQGAPVPVDVVMTPVAELPVVQADAPAVDLLPLVGAAPVLVLDGGAVWSVVTATSLTSALQSIGALPREEPTEPVGRATRGAGEPTARRGHHGAGRFALLTASVGVVVAAAATVPMPVADLAPGPVFDAPSTLATDGPVHPVAGRLLFTSVSITRPSAVGVVGAFFSADHHLTWSTSVVPAGIEPEEWAAAQVQVFRDSVRLAAAVALRAAGYPVRIGGGGAVVWAVVDGSPADGVLLPGDVVTRFGDRPVANAADLVAEVSRAPAGVPVAVVARRGDRRVEATLRPTLSTELDRPTLGVAVEDAAPFVQLPFSVETRRSDVGGPSAGLMTALAVYALTTGADLTGGRVVAGTGTIDADGQVGAVGAVAQKVAAAAGAGANVFLVPSSEAAAARAAAVGRSVRVVAVDSFDGALQALGVSSPPGA